MAHDGKIYYTQDGIQNLYQSLGLILAYNMIDIPTKLSVLQNHYTLLLNILKNSGMTAKPSAQFVKYISYLLRSFESEVCVELKEFVKPIAQTTLEILKSHSSDVTIRENILQLFHKLIIMIGPEITPIVKQFLSLILERECNMNILSGIIKLASQVVHTWKTNSLDFAREVFEYLLTSMVNMEFPANKISDIETSHL